MDDIKKTSIEIDRDHLIDILSEELPSLRAKIGFTQDQISNTIGISRQTYSAIETKRRRMPWNIYLSLIMFFTHNEKTKPIVESIGAFPEELKDSLNISNR